MKLSAVEPYHVWQPASDMKDGLPWRSLQAELTASTFQYDEGHRRMFAAVTWILLAG